MHLFFLARVCACIDSCKGEYTEPVPFTTEQCEPDRPLPPKLLGSRLKNSLTLKWTATPENGSKILNYILEYDEVGFHASLDCSDRNRFSLGQRSRICRSLSRYEKTAHAQ